MEQDVEAAAAVDWRRFTLAVVAVAAATVGFVAWLALRLGGQWVTFTLMDNLAQLMAPVAAALACAMAARRDRGRLGWSWHLLGASATSWALPMSPPPSTASRRPAGCSTAW